MPLILAVDTTSEYGSLALVRDGELLEEALLHAPGSFSPVLYEELARLLERHGVKLADVGCFAAASGPGTFTGVRVALGCV
jgi:tRNA threonylcarbamoyladenosine biosynthesis protein TsaB